MLRINGEFIRAYFEMNNFLVKFNHKPLISEEESQNREEMGLIVVNLNPSFSSPPRKFVLRTENLLGIPRALVEVKAWHSKRFSPSVLFTSLRPLRFLSAEALQQARAAFKTGGFKKILIIPQLPVTQHTQQQSIDILKRKGVDYIIEFRTILEFLIENVKPTKNYADSDSLQLIRLLKNYRLLRENQLNLFKK